MSAAKPTPPVRKSILIVASITFAAAAVFLFSEEERPKTFEESVIAERLGRVSYQSQEGEKPILVNTFKADWGSYEALRHAQKLLSVINDGKFTVQNAGTVRFVALATLTDRLGHETVEPTLQFEFNLDEMRTANLANLSESGLMRLVTAGEVLHPAAGPDIVKVCSAATNPLGTPFCVKMGYSLLKNDWVPD